MSYTYLIGWSKTNMYYYGVRYAKKCTPDDLWNTYFTSSKYVKKYFDEHGPPDIIEIRKTFDSSDKARSWEEKVIRKLNIVSRTDFLNKANVKAIPVELAKHFKENNGMYGKKHTPETLEKMRKPKTEQHKIKLRGKRSHFNQTGSKNNNFKGYILTPFGKFESLEMAALAENVSGGTIHYRLKSSQDKFKEYRRVS